MAENVWTKQNLNQSRKSSNFGVLEMDQNRVENKKFLGCVVFCVLAITSPLDLKIE